jgi:hypothetical protein
MVRVFTISVIIVEVLVLGISACNSNKVRSPYSQEAAKEDIKSGNVKMYSLGLSILHKIPLQQLNLLQSKYGFKDENLGCFANDSLENAIKEYNTVVNAYLTRRNGGNWKRKYHDDVFRMAGVKKVTTP